uniref:50S ribosomal protein L9, chloroplastic n=1 Tax=Chondria sp. (in: red algae) TaxID=1982705 RepID=A0A1Z1ME40_9FLOR|nr:ribosomal protein L9 [Chondria sp. (in: red algae)]
MGKKIQVIITADEFKNKKKGNIIIVSRGYAFNYLIPKNIVEVTSINKIKHFEMFSKIEEAKLTANFIKIENIKNRIAQIKKISICKKQGENHLIFGSIKEKEIIHSINKYTNLKLEKKQIRLNTINQIGTHSIEIYVKQTILFTIQLNVIPNNV